MYKPVKQISITVFIILAMITLLAAPTNAAPSVILNGQQLSFDVSPVVESGSTLVPLRAIFVPLGATVDWDGNTQTVTATKDGIEIKLTLGQAVAYKNGSPVPLSVPAKSIDNRTMVPLRFVSEALGAQVNWDGNTQTITISSVPTSGSALASSPNEQIKVHFIDVGQADSIYIQLPNHNDILIDGGNEADGTSVVNYLKSHGMDDDIELLIATHPHEDHIGGLPAVLNAFKVNEIIDSGDTALSKIYSTYDATAKAEGCTWLADNHQAFTWGNVALQILTGTETWQDVNDYSVVARLDCGNIEFLFDGDAEAPAEAALTGDISAEILKVGHHGSTSSTSPGFLSRVNPQVAVISVGTGNTYGHPASETLTKLQAAGAKVYRTDLNGNIVVTTDGNTYSVITEKNTPAQIPAVVTPIITPVPTETGEPAVQENQKETVYVTKSGTKYHRAGCKYLTSSQRPMSLGDAISAGYTPCSVCNPPK